MATPKKATGSGASAEISKDGTDFQKFASVSSMSGPNLSRGTVEVTDMNSYEDNDQFKEYLTDFIDADEITITGYVLATDAGVSLAESIFYSGEMCYVRINLPKAIGKSMLITGMLTAYQPIGDIATDAGIAYSISMKPTKKPTMVATPTSATTTSDNT